MKQYLTFGKISVLTTFAVAVVIGFQNCGNSGLQTHEVAPDSLEQLMQKAAEDLRAGVLTGVFDVDAYASSECTGDVCVSGERTSFKTEQKLSLKEDKSFAAEGACNSFSGSYQVDPATNGSLYNVRFADIRGSLVACADANASQEEQIFQAVLNNAVRIATPLGDTVEIHSANQAIFLKRLAAAPSNPIVGDGDDPSSSSPPSDGSEPPPSTGGLQPLPSEPFKGNLAGAFHVVKFVDPGCGANLPSGLSGACVIRETVFKSKQRIQFSSNQDQGTFSGQAACNQISGRFTLNSNQGRLTFSLNPRTERGCEHLNEEQLFAERLAATQVVMANGTNEVHLHSQGGYLVLQRKPVVSNPPVTGNSPAAHLRGLFRVVSHVNPGCGAGLPDGLVGTCQITETRFKSNQTLNFQNGKLSGKAACNSFSGTYAFMSTGNGMGVTLGAISRMGCDLLNEETLLTETLAKVNSAQVVNPNRIHLRAPNAQLVLARVGGATTPKPAAALEGSYTIHSYLNRCAVAGAGVIANCAREARIFGAGNSISFTAAGAVQIQTACNSSGGTFKKLANRGLQVSELNSTRKACADPTKQMEETFVLNHISGKKHTYSFRHQGNRLQMLLHTPNGVLVFIKR